MVPARALRIAQAFVVATSFGVSLPVCATPVALTSPTATFCQLPSGGDPSGYPISAAIDGSTSNGIGWAIDPQEATSQVAAFQTVQDLPAAASTSLTFTLDMLYGGQHLIRHFRIAATTASRTTFSTGTSCPNANPGGTASWTVLAPSSVTSASGQTLTVQPDGSVLATGSIPGTDVVTVAAMTNLQGITGFRLEALADSGNVGRADNGNFVLTELIVDQQSIFVPVPTPALDTWSLALLSLLLGGGGLIWMRRRRA
jgi:hypothetical protein